METVKAKVSRGGGFRGALNYVFDVGPDATHTKNAERVGGNMAGSDPRELSREFAAVRSLRPDIARPVWHCSLSLPPGERLSAEKWEAVASDFMERMGFDLNTTPWVAVRHQDTDKDHIHIVASRVGLDGKVWLGQWEARRAIEATQELERTHGLTLTPGLGDARAERKTLTSKEINMAIRTGKEPPRQKLQRILDEVLKDAPTALELADRLAAAGVGVQVNLASTGRMNGFSFGVDGVWFKGSQLGDKYKWGGLQKMGVTYDEARDRAGLERFRAAAADRGERQDVAAGGESPAGAHGELAGRSGGADSRGAQPAGAGGVQLGQDGAGLRPDNRAAAPDAGRIDTGDDSPSVGGIRDARQGARPSHDASDGQPQGVVADRAELGETAGQPQDGGGDADQSSREDGHEPMAAGANPDAGRSRGRASRGDWARHFRQASAAKRRAARGDAGKGALEQSHAPRTRVAETDRQAARTIDPTPYLESRGYVVKREGRHLSVRQGEDEVYRLTRRPEG
ncbi:MAG: relaxase/mobilization nuclease domain-containing protein, partial [Halothiobacillaceae bacterium]